MTWMTGTAWDRRTALSTGALTALAFVVALLLGAATDEGSVPWAERLVRALPVIPLCSALAAALSLRTTQRRGELVALESLGLPPWRAAVPIVIGAAAPAVLMVVAALVPSRADVHSFFPRVEIEGLAWDGDRFVDLSRGVQVLADGTLVRIGKTEGAASGALPWAAKASVGIALAAAAIAIPMHVAGSFPDRRLRASAIVAAAVAPTIVLFQLAAPSIVPALVCAIPSALLLAAAPFCYRQRS